MNITEVRIKIADEGCSGSEKLRAFASVVIDGTLAVRDLRVIEGSGGFFVAMPSRRLLDRCGGCGSKNHLRARFCNHCGGRLDEDRALREADGRAKLHADVAHPISSAGRDAIEAAVVEAYFAEREAAARPGYVCRYHDPETPRDRGPEPRRPRPAPTFSDRVRIRGRAS